MTRLEHLRALLARVQTEIEREEAYLRRMASLRVDYRAHIGRGTWTARIIATTAAHYSLPVDDLTGPTKKANVTEARHVACWLLRDAGRSYPEIGRHIGRDHATVMNAVRRVQESSELMDVAQTVRALLVGEEGAA